MTYLILWGTKTATANITSNSIVPHVIAPVPSGCAVTISAKLMD